MARQPHHSKNWGGARPNSGRPKGSKDRDALTAIQKAAEAEVHPFDYLLSVVADKNAPQKMRVQAATVALPYCQARLSSTEVNIRHELTDESEEMLVSRLLSAQSQLVRLGLSVVESEAVNGDARE